MANTATQDDAVTNGKADKVNQTAGSSAHSSPVISNPVFVSGAARQLSNARDQILYIDIVTAASLKIEMGPDSTAANVISAAKSDALGLITLRVPVDWYVKITGTIANLVITQLGL